MLAPLEVQAAPVAAAPFEQEQVFWGLEHTRLVVAVQAVISVLPTEHAAAHWLHFDQWFARFW